MISYRFVPISNQKVVHFLRHPVYTLPSSQNVVLLFFFVSRCFCLQIHSLSVIASICGSDERHLYRGLFFSIYFFMAYRTAFLSHSSVNDLCHSGHTLHKRARNRNITLKEKSD